MPQLNNETKHLEAIVKSAPLEEIPTNVLVVGVGGQGVIMISKVLAALCQEQGFDVKQSEVHGMAKRGGSVFSHVRFGRQVFSPTIPKGDADILVALEWAEGLRWLPYLKPEKGIFIGDTQRIVPPFACRDRRRFAASGYVQESVDQVIRLVPNSSAMDAVAMARELGVPKAANTILLGALSTTLNFEEAAWKSVIARFVPPKTVDANLQAFDSGRAWIRNFDRQADSAMEAGTALDSGAWPMEQDQTWVEINTAWCKSCDICVKLCPERCLALDDQQLVQLIKPEACTGCRVCERLCPDFAINIHTPAFPELRP
ncbi:MAG: 2-oxoacid:acceptor oxidoreductase family protein [SAR324 cluster bacterium]|nr:2-oxoacid:acceptor oxidoreductase family protein [SAR324 cluster bacterium]